MEVSGTLLGDSVVEYPVGIPIDETLDALTSISSFGSFSCQSLNVSRLLTVL